jgi:hypothetical protein
LSISKCKENLQNEEKAPVLRRKMRKVNARTHPRVIRHGINV